MEQQQDEQHGEQLVLQGAVEKASTGPATAEDGYCRAAVAAAASEAGDGPASKKQRCGSGPASSHEQHQGPAATAAAAMDTTAVTSAASEQHQGPAAAAATAMDTTAATAITSEEHQGPAATAMDTSAVAAASEQQGTQVRGSGGVGGPAATASDGAVEPHGPAATASEVRGISHDRGARVEEEPLLPPTAPTICQAVGGSGVLGWLRCQVCCRCVGLAQVSGVLAQVCWVVFTLIPHLSPPPAITLIAPSPTIHPSATCPYRSTSPPCSPPTPNLIPTPTPMHERGPNNPTPHPTPAPPHPSLT